MIVSRCTGSFVALESLGSEGTGSPVPEVAMHFGSGGNSAVEHLVSECFWCFVGLVFGVHHPIFLYIFANGVIQSLSTLFCFWWYCCTGGWLFLYLRLNLYGWFRTGSSNSVVSRNDWPIFSQFREVPQHFSCLRPWDASTNWDVF